MSVKIFGIVSLLLIALNCSEEPPVIPPPPIDDTIKNTITISVEWQELTTIALSWNKSLIDTLSTFGYKLKRKDTSGNETEFNTGQDTTFIDDNEGNGLSKGTEYSYKLEASENNNIIDTSNTVVSNTLSVTSHEISWSNDS